MWLNTDILDRVLNHENLALLINTYLLLDKTFVKNLDNTITGGQLQNTSVETVCKLLRNYVSVILHENTF
jgi:hypothetical protein